MGSCVSSSHHHHNKGKCCQVGCFRFSKKTNKNTTTTTRLTSFRRILSKRSIDKLEDTSQTNPNFQDKTEEDWFDSVNKFDSDSEEDFLSVRNDSMSPRDFNGASVSSVSSVMGSNQEKYDGNVIDQQKQWEFSVGNTRLALVREMVHNSLAKNFLCKPKAGSQVVLCPIEKKVFGTWSHLEPGTFKVRAENYLRDKRKDFPPNYAAYYPFGVDVFLSQRKVDHIARFVELPLTKFHGKFPPMLIVNVQIPLYSPSIFQRENDGEGMSVVLYFRLSESYSKNITSHFLENLTRIINNEVEEVKGYRVNPGVPVRERLKILGRVANVDDLPLNSAERKLMHAYNGKPILSRPQHEFYLGGNYMEIDLDMHRFSYISRKGFDTFQDRLKHCILDVGLTIQGNKADELPEQILCCLRLNGIDHTDYHHLGLHLGQESL